MIFTLIIILIVLLVALWAGVMFLWWQREQEHQIKIIDRGDVIRSWNKAARLARRSWYGGGRYTRQAALWGSKKAGTTFMTVFPRSRPAFAPHDPLTGLAHGPSSYFLANLSRKISKKNKSATEKK
jgi:hypothetical protein